MCARMSEANWYHMRQTKTTENQDKSLMAFETTSSICALGDGSFEIMTKIIKHKINVKTLKTRTLQMQQNAKKHQMLQAKTTTLCTVRNYISC